MKLKAFSGRTTRRNEAGQVILFVLLGLGIFLIGAMAFAIDLSNMWFNRQSAQTAADAACTAGAMDMLVGATNGTMPTGANFTAAAANTYDCKTASPLPAPCSYAALNGYGSSISRSSANSGTLGDNVFLDFPSASSVNLSSLSFPPSTVAASPLIRVKIVNNISTWFAGMLGITKQGTGASAICAVEYANSPIPILVLHPTMSASLTMNGGGSKSGTGCGNTPCGDIVIAGGPSKSIQVNSSSATAINFSGGPTIDLCAGGNTYCGSGLGVAGADPNPGSSNFWTSTATCSVQNSGLCTGSQNPPLWQQSPPLFDPLSGITAPDVPTASFVGTGGGPGSTPPYKGASGIVYPSQGCPDPTGCVRFTPGAYPNGIDVSGETAIFDPGIYYIGGNASHSGHCGPGGSGSFCLGAGGCIRPSSNTGDGSGGVIIYFADSNSVYAGGAGTGCGAGVVVFNTATGGLGTGVKCIGTGTGTTQIPPNMPATLTGSVLLAPCQAPTAGSPLCASATTINAGGNCSLNFGDPQGANDKYGEQRGILFFQNRAVNANNNPKWVGNGSVLLAGTMYFHQCVASGSDTGLGCSGSVWNDQLNLGGTSGSSTYVLGDTIVDQLSVGGNGQIIMDLNPSAANTTLKAALVQ